LTKTEISRALAVACRNFRRCAWPGARRASPEPDPGAEAGPDQAEIQTLISERLMRGQAKRYAIPTPFAIVCGPKGSKLIDRPDGNHRVDFKAWGLDRAFKASIRGCGSSWVSHNSEPEGLLLPAGGWRPLLGASARYRGARLSTFSSMISPPSKAFPELRAPAVPAREIRKSLEPEIAAARGGKPSLAPQCGTTPLPSPRGPLGSRAFDGETGSQQMRASLNESESVWLGSTGSIRHQTLQLGEEFPDRFGVVALTAGPQPGPASASKDGRPLPRGWWPLPIPSCCPSSKPGLMPWEPSARPAAVLSCSPQRGPLRCIRPGAARAWW